MDDIRNSNHIIKSEDELYEYCDFAKDVLEYANKLAERDKINWFFDTCYCDWNTETHFVIFKSYITHEYKNFSLSLKVTKDSNGKYVISVQKKITELC